MESASARKKQTVLVVDDDCQVLKSLLLLLRAYEYNVVTADNAEATLYKLRNMDVNAEFFFEKTHILRVGGNVLYWSGRRSKNIRFAEKKVLTWNMACDKLRPRSAVNLGQNLEVHEYHPSNKISK